MENAKNRERVYKAMEDTLRKDRARTNILKISDLGLIEMTRKRVQEDLVSSISEECPYCHGTGNIRAKHTVVYEIIREIQRVSNKKLSSSSIFVNSNPKVAYLLYGQELSNIEEMELNLRKRIIIRAMPHYHVEKFDVYSR